MFSARKVSDHRRLDSLCKYTVENLEFLDTPTHIDVATIHKYKTIIMVLIASVQRIIVLPM